MSGPNDEGSNQARAHGGAKTRIYILTDDESSGGAPAAANNNQQQLSVVEYQVSGILFIAIFIPVDTAVLLY